MLTLINDILDFSKIEAGKLELEVTDFDLRTSVEEVLDILAERAAAKRLELAYLLHPQIETWVQGDPGRLRQILLNLVGNAIKFTHTGEVVVRLMYDVDAPEHDVIRFEIADTGIGISPKVQAMLFQPFTQADASTTRQYGGTGLGLAICARLAEKFGGAIGVESTPGQGSTFWFTAHLPKSAVSRHSELQPVSGMEELRVLCVDDNATNRALIELQLQAWHIQVDTQADGPSALARMQAAHRAGTPYDLVISDMQMPGMDGLMLALVIKADPNLASTRLIILSSVGQRDHDQQVEIDAYLTKPVRQSQLYDHIALVMSRAAQATSPPAVQRPGHTPSTMQAKVLLAEDNVVNQKVAVRILEKLGCRVEAVANGLEALDALSRIPYDLVLMDCQMPEMDGYIATAAIRKREVTTGTHIPIIAMTANALIGDRERCLQAGMDDYISKPVHADQLLEVVQKWAMSPDGPSAIGAEQEGRPASEAASCCHSVLDMETFNALRNREQQSAPGALRHLVDAFIQDAQAHIAALYTAVDARDIDTLTQVAHLLNIRSAPVGAIAMVTSCQALESHGDSDVMHEALPVVEQLEIHFIQTRQTLYRLFY